MTLCLVQNDCKNASIIKPKIGSNWLFKDHNKVAYTVEEYYDDDNVICSFDIGFGKQRSFPFPWRGLIKYYRLGPSIVK